MNHVYHLRLFAGGALILAPLTQALAQQAVTVSGHISAGGGPLAGAHVRIDELRPPIDRVTDQDGHYSFIVPSSNVHGQTVKITVTMTDRRIRYESVSGDIQLVGIPVLKDFDLKIVSGDRPVVPTFDTVTKGPGKPRGPASALVSTDTLNLGDASGAVDVLSALAGRFPGLAITQPNVLGGSSSALFRGPRSALGTSEPLVVLDGVPLISTVFTSSAQRYGVGGFDYGSPLEDLDISTIASVRFLTGPEASTRFGSRAANGVLLLQSKNGAGGPGFAISARQQFTSEKHGRLPVFQNQFGQGLNGKFQFFDGKGGGVNDAVDQSWGPAIQNQPITQASLTEAGQGDVRLWAAHPGNTDDYFASGRTVNTTIAVQSASDVGSFRASFGNRDTHGLTPGSTLLLRTGAFSGTATPTDAITASAWVGGGQNNNDTAPGTGFNQGNPVSQFTRLGRQVDATALRSHLVDASGKQISWHYAGQNNPYFASLENTNQSERNHVSGGGSLAMVLSPWLDATVRSGTDYFRDARAFYIRNGWMGGFPFFAAPSGGNFSKGGSEADEIASQETSSLLRLDGHRTLSNKARWTVAAGADLLSGRSRIRTAGVDSAANIPIAGAPDTATIPSAVSWNAHARTTGAFGETGLAFANSGVAKIGLRNEWASIGPGQHSTTLYPSVSGSIDLVRAVESMKTQTKLSAATLRASWAMSSGELTPFVLQTLYAGRAPSGSLTPSGAGALPTDTSLKPEVTSALQVGADLSFWQRRFDLGLTLYHEATSDVIFAVPDASLGTVSARNAGSITNSGIEAQATVRFGGDSWLGWEISGNAAKNSNSVDKVFGSTAAVDIAPQQWGLHVQARQGEPLGVLVGERFLRDASTHALVLRNGLPLPDTVAGPTKLGDASPDWVLGLRNSFRIGSLTVDVLADGRIGGSIFSATNLWGSYAGSLAETAFRPDSGLLIAGIDAASGKANTQHVPTQDYYHALGAIQEPWVYSASFMKVREVRARIAIPTSAFGGLPFSGISASIVARNVYLWAKAPNIDPETLLSPYQFGGVEMGQLPATKSIGFQLSITP